MNPVMLIPRDRGNPDDNRQCRDEVAHPGDVVTLLFETEHPDCPGEYVRVRVLDRVDASRRLYRGVVLDDPLPALVPSGKLKKGDTLVFTGRDVFAVEDPVTDRVPTEGGAK